MRFIPYLNFNGQCEAAFKFYAQVFGGKIEMMMSHGDSPIAEHVPPELHKTIMHARLSVGDQV
jgi:PhnB protein